ncbi:MAG: DNA alkylation repair protein [Bacteroidales bacterium]|nr:DNA alkylation repair protein [Bacteroidales bacterium]
MNHIGQKIAEELECRRIIRKADWWNRYMKGVIPFLGLGIPEIRKVLLELNQSEKMDQLALNQQVGLVNGLMKGSFAEEKLAAILYIQLFWLGKMKNMFLVNLISDWFDDRYILDWNTADWLCVRLLTPMIDTGDSQVILKLKQWNLDPYLWKARSSLVPFAQVSTIPDYSREIWQFSNILIRREERFAKTAVGWVLREYSKHDTEFVLTFLSKHVRYTTAEVKRNALKYYRQSLRP